MCCRSALLFKRETEDRLQLLSHESAMAVSDGSLNLDGSFAQAADRPASMSVDILSADLLLRVPPPPAYSP